MSLFSELRRLYRTDRYLIEDPHTEIVAQVLRNSDALTFAWLHSVGVTSLQGAKIRISTQQTFRKLKGHSKDSRPDITMWLSAVGIDELIFVESKVPSTQGDDQLQRYADHLAVEYKKSGLSKASLIYITRDYETVMRPAVSNSQFQPEFYPTRWFQFYKHLKAHVNGDGLAKELKLFMEENRMSLGNQFRSTDLVALENFFSAKSLMDETLEGEVSETIKAIFDGLYAVRKSVTYFRDEHRYAASNPNWNVIECHVGYWLPHQNPDEPVWAGVALYSNPSAPNRERVIEAFRGWLEKVGNGWWGEEMDDKWAKCCICKGKSLQALMGSEDHVRATKDYLLDLLKDVEKFRNMYPNLCCCAEGGSLELGEKRSSE